MPASVRSARSTEAAVATANAAHASIDTARPIAGLAMRVANREDNAAPMAMPMMKIATTVLNAYVVGPRICTRRRVHTTCNVSDAKPLTPRASAASHGHDMTSAVVFAV